MAARQPGPVSQIRLKHLVSTLCLVLVGTACGIASSLAAPTATAVTSITRERSIELAIPSCQFFDLALVGKPRNIRSQLITLDEANKEITKGGYVNYKSPVGTLVWLVQIDGRLQIVGGVMPTPGQGPAVTPNSFEGTCAVLLDANTGDVMGMRLTP